MKIQPTFSQLNKLDENKLIRNGAVIHLKSPFVKIYWCIKDLFAGGRGKQNRKEFERFYPLLNKKITQIKGAGFQHFKERKQLKEMLVLQAKIEASAFGKGLKQGQKFAAFTQMTLKVQKLAQKKVSPPVLPKNPVDQIRFWRKPSETFTVKRWIYSNPLQRVFAVNRNTDFLPMRGDEVPGGSLLLTDPFADAKGHLLLGRTLNFNQKRKLYFDGPMVKLISGKALTHTTLGLGHENYFHLGKPDKGKPSGLYETWTETKNLHRYRIYLPSETLIKKIGKKNFPKFLEKLNKEARTHGVKKRATLFTMVRMFLAFISKRKKGETFKNYWDRTQMFSCSGAITALFAKYGIDIGKEFNKKPYAVHPTHLSKSKYFSEVK